MKILRIYLLIVFSSCIANAETVAVSPLNEPEVQPTSIEGIIRETKVGYIKRAPKIRIKATPSDIVVVMMGGSGGPKGDNTLGGSDMTDQGFNNPLLK